MLYTYQEETIWFDLNYKKQNTITITCSIHGEIKVNAPKEMPIARIHLFLEEHWELIQEKKKEVLTRGIEQAKNYEQGELYLYLGKEYSLNVIDDSNVKKDHVIFVRDTLQVSMAQPSNEKIQLALKRFYYKQCKSLVEKRIQHYQGEFKSKPSSITITESNATWGTCNSKRQLTFHWKLAMVPLEVLDYVVIHELCHLVHMNHDRSFWRLVGKLCPDFEQHQQWLASSNYKMSV